MVPIIGFRPQTVELSILAISAAGLRASYDSKISDEFTEIKNIQINVFIQRNF